MDSQPDLIFIDVRTPSEFIKGHVSRSLFVTFKDSAARILEISDLVALCTYYSLCSLTISAASLGSIVIILETVFFFSLSLWPCPQGSWCD